MDIINLSYLYIVKVLEIISHELHLEKYPNWRQWGTDSRRLASALLAGIAAFEFCIVWTTVVRSLFYSRGPTKVSWSLNLLDVVGQVEVARKDLTFIWNDGAKEYFSRCFEYVLVMVSLTDTVPSMPWIATHQQHQINAESDASFNYYRKSMCLPFLDHLINKIDVRFNKYGKTILMMQAFILSAFDERDVTIDGIVKV